MKKIKCLVCNQEFDSQEDFEFHILKPEIEERERARKKKVGGWGYSISDIEEKHRLAFDESKKEGWRMINEYGYQGKCALCSGDIDADWWCNEGDYYGWSIKCKNCGILFDED